MRSIRRALLLALLAAVGAAVLLSAIATYRMAREAANAMSDYQLRQLALSLRDRAFQSGLAPPLDPGGERDFDFVIQVWDRAGVRLYFSHPRSALPNRAQLGFATIETREGAWRVFSTQLRGQTIQVAQPMSVREALATDAALRAVAPFVFLLPVLGALIWIVVARALSPLHRVAQAVTARTPVALDPLPERDLPVEVLPLVHALNDLLARLKQALAVQRAFIADAAHELRTPLAALTLQAQLSERAGTEIERAAALAELRHGLKRATRVVQQLLTLARQEPEAGERPFARVALGELARRAVAEQVALAEARGIDLGASTVEDAVVSGDSDALRILLGNLVENAVRYTPEGGRVDVSVVTTLGAPCLEVTDTGPGIPPEERERVFDRFYRHEGAAEPGSGLGLAIVKAIAERHRATVTLQDAAGGGLRVRVAFPSSLSLP